MGKTTTCVNLAASLAAMKQRVLLVDLDPQGNATMGSGIDKHARAELQHLRRPGRTAPLLCERRAGTPVRALFRRTAGQQRPDRGGGGTARGIEHRERRLRDALAAVRRPTTTTCWWTARRH